MTSLVRLAGGLLLVAACQRFTSPPAYEPAQPPVVAEKARAASVPRSELDRQLVLGIGDDTSIQLENGAGVVVQLSVKSRVGRTEQLVDVVVEDQVLDTLDSGVPPGDFHMEVTWAIGAVPEGVLVRVHATKVTGKPADYYTARVYHWHATRLVQKREIRFEDVYDPSADL